MGLERILFRFSKEGEARFLSHHDLLRLFERAVRRAQLPVRMSEGYNPHPKIRVLCALPVGVEAEDEPLEVEFDEAVDADVARDRLAEQLPAGIAVRSAERLSGRPSRTVAAMAYEAELPGSEPLTGADVERFLARDAIGVERERGTEHRMIDIRPALEVLRLDGRRLHFRLRAGARGTPKAVEVVAALLGRPVGGDPHIRVRRTQVSLSGAQPPSER